MKKLGLEEKLVLQLVLLQAEVPIPELAKQAGMRPHKLRYILSSFEESGVFLGKRAHVNAAAIGLVEYQTYLSLGAATDAQHREFPKFVAALKKRGRYLLVPSPRESGKWKHALKPGKFN